jgi:dipeptidase E
MTTKNLLLLSSSRVAKTDYLAHAKKLIKTHLGDINELLFIPYAGVTIGYDDYTEMVQNALVECGIKVSGIHQYSSAKDAINNAQAIAVGGGNTFNLLHQLYQHDLIETIQKKVSQGTPYIGWSAGSNIAGLTIKTTNDMPIVEPASFNALALVDFQLNPHYTDFNPPGHNGETREQRLAEFMVLNPTTPIVAIVEGSALKLHNNQLSLVVTEQVENVGYVFKGGEKQKINTTTSLNYLL